MVLTGRSRKVGWGVVDTITKMVLTGRSRKVGWGVVDGNKERNIREIQKIKKGTTGCKASHNMLFAITC